MSHLLPSASRERGAVPSRVARPEAWAAKPGAGSDVAVLLTDCADVPAVVRGCRTVLPRAQIVLYGSDLSAAERASAEAAGAAVRIVPPSSRDALVRRMLAEIEADVYILAHAADAADMCLAPLIVAEVDAGRDLVDVRRCASTPAGDTAERLLDRTVDFAFGGGSDALRSGFKACSRRFALSYRRTAPRDGSSDASARDLALHALRLRMPIGRVAALGSGGTNRTGIAPRSLAGRIETLVIAGRLLVDERPRRVFGLLGLSLMALGLAAAVPELKFYHWRAALLPGGESVVALALLAAGALCGAAGLLLDSLASARQEVGRLGLAAIPRRNHGDGSVDLDARRQSSVS